MKKILLSTLAGLALLTTSVSANNDGIIVEQHIGYSNISMGEDSGHGANFGFDFAIPIFGADKIQGFNVGLGVEVEGASIDNSTGGSTGVWGGNGKAFVGYNFKDFNVRAGGGYQYLSINDSSYVDGFVMTSSAGWNFSEKYGIQVTYKTGDLSLNGSGPDISTDIIGVSFVFHN